MATQTYKGDFYTNVAGVVAGTLSAGSFNNASKTKLRAKVDTITFAADADAASVTSMGLLPKGARVIGFYFASEAQGVAVTADIEVGGVAATTAEVLTDMTSATQQLVPCVEAVSKDELTVDSVVTIINAAQAFKATKRIILATLYLIED